MRTRKMLKTLLLTTAIVFSAAIAQAQEKNDMAAGLNLVCGTNSTLTNLGLGLKYQWNITAPIRLEPGFNFYFPKDLVGAKYNMWDLNVNVHYLFTIKEKFMLYPLAGIGILGSSIKYKYHNYYDDYGIYGDLVSAAVKEVEQKSTSTNFAFNIGGGAEYKINEKFAVNFEIKYQIVSNWNRPVFLVGATYKFK